MIMSGSAVRIRSPVHMDMLGRARALQVAKPRAPPPFFYSRGCAATVSLQTFIIAAAAAAKNIPGGCDRDPKHIPGGYGTDPYDEED